MSKQTFCWKTWFAAMVLTTAVLVATPARAVGNASDVALFNPTSGQWHIRYSNGATQTFFYGNPGDLPLLGDWDCNGTDTVAMFRPSNGFIYLRNSNAQGVADLEFFYGIGGDLPLAGDWNGDGCDTFSIYRPSESKVYVANTLGTVPAEFSYYYGIPGDRPFAGDFDGNGIASVGLYRDTTGFVYFRNTLTTGVADFDFFYGEPSDRIVAGDWDGDGDATVGIYRSRDRKFYLSNANAQGFADIEIAFGESTWLPLAGKLGFPPPCGQFASFALSGAGSNVVSVAASASYPAVLDFSHGGSSNFIVWSEDSAFTKVDLLVNEIGAYQGTRPINHSSATDGVQWLEISASEAWTIQVKPFCEMRIINGNSIIGTGDDVVTVNRSGPATLTHIGTSNFIVWSYQGANRLDLEVNEIGTFTGTLVIDPGTEYLEIQADGYWTVTFQ